MFFRFLITLSFLATATCSGLAIEDIVEGGRGEYKYVIAAAMLAMTVFNAIILAGLYWGLGRPD